MSIPADKLQAILNSPAQVSPDGVYHLDNPPNKNAQGIIAASVCVAISTAVLMLRVYSRLMCMRKARIEDGLALLGFITYIGMFVNLVLLSQSPGLWVHTWDIRVKDIEPYIKKTFSFITCYGLTMIFVKAAVLLEWIHIFVPSQRNLFFWTSYAVIFMNGMLYTAAIIATWLTCIPQETIWHPWIPGSCFDRKRMDETVIVFNLVFDIIILLLPQRVIWKLNTKRKHKYGIALVFSVGVMACACAAGRVYATFTLDYYNDATYHAPEPILWAIAEGTCVLMVFCITAAPKVFNSNAHLLTKIAHSVRSWTRLAWTSRDGSPRISPRSSRKGSRESVYQRMDEPEVPLATLDPTKIKANSQVNGIVQTTEFSTQEVPNPDNTGALPLERQHPWMKDSPSGPAP